MLEMKEILVFGQLREFKNFLYERLGPRKTRPRAHSILYF